MKNYANVCFASMLHYVNLLFTTAEFPKLWKIAKVVTLFKKSFPFDCSNNIPILQLFTISKTFGKCPCQCFYSFLVRNIVIYKHQLFDIRSGYSTNHDNVKLVENMKKYNDVDNYMCLYSLIFKKLLIT